MRRLILLQIVKYIRFDIKSAAIQSTRNYVIHFRGNPFVIHRMIRRLFYAFY